ncbi:type III effector [Erwinia psidii]|uniref:AvrPphF family type III effector n=1 Tax=Erwinia psidii TaxID=69224 RepID=UPI00226B927D|nr:AvrPphF family type III effector [Erwinia psidii]MCX8966165.1 type III effector [Erwinia psidii]
MGNICSSGGSHHVYSPPVSPRHSAYSAGTSSPVGHAGGQPLTSVYQLSHEARSAFLNNHDPMIVFDLHAETPLYRTTNRRHVKDGMIAGNPGSCARIALHEELRSNPYTQHYNLPADDHRAYFPKQIRASELPDPSLNVMTGPMGRQAIGSYSSANHVAVEMRLGDFLEKGGKVYSDVSAVASDEETATALIVTLPKGKKVPVKVLDD